MKPTEDKLKICSDCKQEPATIIYGESVLDITHGFTRNICQKCYNKIRDNCPWFKEGKKIGKSQQINEVLKIIGELKLPDENQDVHDIIKELKDRIKKLQEQKKNE